MLSAFLAFCDRPVYKFYVTHANSFHVSRLDDQVLGAVIMWVLGSFAFLIPAVAITLRLVGFSRREELDRNYFELGSAPTRTPGETKTMDGRRDQSEAAKPSKELSRLAL